MATPLFCVDLSEDARDYRHTALEPGLPLLDRQHVNYQILRKWLGDYIAEPEWRNEDTVAFYMSEEERGRLEDVDCQPVTKGELEKKFAQDLENIRVKIKKIRPESSTEQMVHRILKKNIAEQTNDLDSSDFDSYFFKCRTTNEDWRLIWCCGFQRADLEPLKAKLWRTPEGEFLGVRQPLQGGRVKKKKRRGPLAVLASPWLAIALILLLALFLYAYWPKLVVTPNAWTGPLGSRIEFKVEDHRWFFFENDVTSRALAQSNDPRIVEFVRGGVANAIDTGETSVSFLVDNRMVFVPVRVKEATPPDSLTIEPGDGVKVPIGATENLKAIGHYADGITVDLTTQVSWSEQDDKDLLVFREGDKGLIQGDSVGTTKVLAQYPIPRDNDTYAETSIGVQVVQAEFTSLRVALQSETFAVGQTSRINVFGVDKQGEEHSLSGSSLLSCKVAPTTAAEVDGTYLVGATESSGKLKVIYADLDESVDFTVDGRMLADDVFLVTPTTIDNAIVHELIGLNVRTGTDEPITAVTANGDVVDVFRTEGENAGYEVWLAARGLGQTEVTVSQGSKSAVVNVTVVEGSIERMQFNPPVYALKVGQPVTASLEGTTNTERLIKVVPDAVVWELQPRLENVEVDKKTLRLDPLEATQVVQDMQVRLVSTDLLADATVTVSGELTDIAMLDEGFGVHPPISGRRWLDAGKSFYFDADADGVVFADTDPFSVVGSIPKGSVLTDLDGVSLVGMGPDELAAYFRTHQIGPDSVIRYRDGDGLFHTQLLTSDVGAILDFKLLNVEPINVTQESFNAQLRLYLRLPGNYQLTDATGAPLTELAAFPADATPLIETPALARNAEDAYELWLNRQIGDQTKRFQIPFNLGRATRTVGTVDVNPVVIDRGPDVIVDPAPDRVIVDDNDDHGRTRVKRTIKRVRRSGDGASVIRSGGDTVVVSGSDGGTRVVSPSGTGTRMVSAPGSSVAGSPGSGSRSPGSPSAASPSPGSPSPSSPSPASPSSGSPSPASPSPSPASPSPNSPSPASPSPAKPSPTNPSPANPKPSPAPANPSPANPKPSPAPASPSPKPQGSDTRAPAAPAKPAPASPALAKPTPSGSDTRAPSPFRPRTPAGGEAQPASAYGNAVPAGSGTRTAGTPAAGRVTGAAAGAAKTMPPTYTGREPPKVKTKEGEKNPLLQALEQFNKDRKKRENITGKGRIPVIKSSKDEDK